MGISTGETIVESDLAGLNLEQRIQEIKDEVNPAGYSTVEEALAAADRAAKAFEALGKNMNDVGDIVEAQNKAVRIANQKPADARELELKRKAKLRRKKRKNGGPK